MSPADLQCSELRQSWEWTLAGAAPAATWDRVGPRQKEASTRALFRARTSRKHPPPGHPPRQMGARARAGPWEPACGSGEAGHRWGGRRGRQQMGARLAPTVRQRRRADVCDQMFEKSEAGAWEKPDRPVSCSLPSWPQGRAWEARDRGPGLTADVMLCSNHRTLHHRPTLIYGSTGVCGCNRAIMATVELKTSYRRTLCARFWLVLRHHREQN